MSYTIMYGKQFLKTSRGIIPLALHGDNNVTEYVRGREGDFIMKRLDSSELRALCIRNNWFTCGNIRQYTRFFPRNSEGATAEELSVIIWICSDDIPYHDIYVALCKAMDTMPKIDGQ